MNIPPLIIITLNRLRDIEFVSLLRSLLVVFYFEKELGKERERLEEKAEKKIPQRKGEEFSK